MSGYKLTYMTMTMKDTNEKLLSLIREMLQYKKITYKENEIDEDAEGSYEKNKIELYEETLLATGLTKQRIELGLKKLQEDGVIKLQQIFFSPERTLSNYDSNSQTKYKVPADEIYKLPVYVLHIDVEKLAQFGATNPDVKVKFVEKESALLFDEKKVQLPPNKNEFALCRIMFDGVSPNEPVSWDEIYEGITGDKPDERANERQKRTVYDTFLRINERIQREVGVQNFFIWEGTTVRRIR